MTDAEPARTSAAGQAADPDAEHVADPGADTEPDPAGDGRHRTAAIVLAGGGGSRFTGERHKLLTELDGRPIAERAIATALDAAIGPVVVVTGAVDLGGLDADVLDRVIRVHNPDWAAGQSTSLQVGLAAANRLHGVDAVVVGLADQPAITAEAWRRVAAARAPIAIATYDGRPRNPVRLAREVWPLMPTEGDAGARAVARLRPELVEQIPCPGSAADIDTLEDLRTWQNRSSTNSP